MYTIYMHRNKINGKIYIGQTCQKPSYRWKRNGKGYETCEIMWKAIQKYGWNNFEHIILKSNLTLEEANFYEKYYIKKFNSTNKQFGYNIRKGGKNTPLSEETKKNISNLKSMAVLQYDLNGNFIAEYKSAQFACQILNFCDKSCISKACLGQRKTAHGFIWKYKK